MRKIVVTPYNPNWPHEFDQIKNELALALQDSVLAIEHVGSTAVPELWAKPIIDIDVIIEKEKFETAKDRLREIGYAHVGNLGIEGREAFKYGDKPHLAQHHLYVCDKDAEELTRHLALRDYLRVHKEYCEKYSKIKAEMAEKHPHDIDAYLDGKQPVILEIYEKCGLNISYKKIMLTREKLFIPTIADSAATLARAHGVGIELDEFCTAQNMDAPGFTEWKQTARANLAAATRHILHAPFMELCPAAVDSRARQLTMDRLTQARDLAMAYGIPRMVAHAGFIPRLYYPEWFVEQSVLFWQAFLKDTPPDFTVLVENVLEPDPALLSQVAAGVNDPRFRICLDIGHAFLTKTIPLNGWIDTLAPWLSHVHLHNNHGERDEHNPGAEGLIPMDEVIARIERKAPAATFTLETTRPGEWLEAILHPSF